jgi:hypothetical protein
MKPRALVTYCPGGRHWLTFSVPSGKAANKYRHNIRATGLRCRIQKLKRWGAIERHHVRMLRQHHRRIALLFHE